MTRVRNIAYRRQQILARLHDLTRRRHRLLWTRRRLLEEHAPVQRQPRRQSTTSFYRTMMERGLEIAEAHRAARAGDDAWRNL